MLYNNVVISYSECCCSSWERRNKERKECPITMLYLFVFLYSEPEFNDTPLNASLPS